MKVRSLIQIRRDKGAAVGSNGIGKKLGWFGLMAGVVTVAEVRGEEFGGIEFPQGVASFADEVVEYDPHHSGGAVPSNPNFTDPAEALGPPDYSGGSTGTGSVSLGSGGRLTLKFTNNKLTGSGDSADDLHIFEVGPQVEATAVETLVTSSV